MSGKIKVLFLNPPGKKIYIRDYYCSKVSKAYYLPQPVDLLIQTSFFEQSKYELKLIDCIVEGKGKSKAYSEIKRFNPQYIVGLFASVSLEEDIDFYSNLKLEIPETKILASGDALLENHELQLQQYEWLDVIITNFYNDGAKQWIENKLEFAEGIVYKNNFKVVTKAEKKLSKLQLPLPRHDLFLGKKYRMPFANALPMATVLTNYACPYPCTFCIMSTMPYITRSAESIIAELIELKRLNYKYIYFSDQTFFQSKAVTKKVLEWIIETNYDISWMCFSRVDVLGREEIELMKKAGCNLIMFGVEWADEAYLKEYKKNYTLEQVRETFKLTAEAGIKRLGTFLIGVPGQSKASILNTLRFAKEIEADYASFNVAVPRSKTSFREKAIESGIIDSSVKIMDQSGHEVTMGTGVLSRDELQRLKKWVYFSFYFRPSYIWKRLKSIKNCIEFKMHLREAYFILK
ncbi:MAG: radical SAM protein [Vicingaceae bacterium]